jgi:hypothetical protein
LTVERVNPELLAAFLDGKLSGDERARVVATLADSEEDYEALLNAAAIAQHLDPAPQVVRRRARFVPTGRARYVLAVVGSAAVLLLAVLPFVRRGAGNRPVDFLRATAASSPRGPGSMASTFGSGWETPSWTAVRGPADVLSSRARAFRLGARVAQLELSFELRDSAAVSSAALPLAQLAGELEAGTPVSSMVLHLAGTPGLTTVDQRRALFESARAIAHDTAWFDVGVWAEGSRLSLRAERETRIARGHHIARQLERVVDELDRLPEGERAAMESTIARLQRLRDELARSEVPVARLALVVDSTLVEGAR